MKQIIIGIAIAVVIVCLIDLPMKYIQVKNPTNESDSLRLELDKAMMECEKNYEKFQLNLKELEK